MASSLAAPQYSLHVSSFNTDKSSEFEFDLGTFSELGNKLPVSPKLVNHSQNYEGVSASTMSSIDHTFAFIDDSLSAAEGKVQRRVNLGSLLSRRDLGDLSPLSHDHLWKEDVRSPASAGSSACSNYLADQHSPDPEDSVAADDAELGASPDNKTRHKKSRKWTFSLNFLKKGLSPGARDQQSLHRIVISNKQRADYRSNYQFDDCTSSAAAMIGSGSVPISEDYMIVRHSSNAAAAESEERINQQQLKSKRMECDEAAATVQEARHSTAQLANQSVEYMGAYRAGQASTAIDQEINSQYADPDSYVAVARTAATSRTEIPRRSSPSLAASQSAPASPAQSPGPARPLRYVGENGPFTARWRPMSPHAKHYEQQRARTEEQKRKTFLPYRQSLVSACFFPLPADHSQNLLEAVY